MGKFKSKNVGQPEEARGLLKKEEEQEYARVIKTLGGSRFRLQIGDKEIIGKLRGKLQRRRKSNWVGPDTVVLVCMRDFQDSVVDIIHVYEDSEVRKLKKSGVFVEEVSKIGVHKEDEKLEEEDDDCPFDFDDI